MSSLFASIALLFATSSAPAAIAELPSEPTSVADQREARPDRTGRAVIRALERGVRHGGGFRGHWRELEPDALQEAWCLVLEHHPDVVELSDDAVRRAVVDVPRRDGRVVRQPLERRLMDLGIQARNAVLRDNHLNRRTGGRPARFAAWDDALRPDLTARGVRTPKAPTS